MKKTLQDVLNDIQDNLIGKELHGISGTASSFRISEIDYEKEMARIQSEMKEIMKQEKKSQQMLEEAFRGIGYGID